MRRQRRVFQTRAPSFKFDASGSWAAFGCGPSCAVWSLPPRGRYPVRLSQSVAILLLENGMSPLLILALFLPLQNKAPEKCSLSGTVVDSATGEPLSKVELRLQPLDAQATHVEKGRATWRAIFR